MFIFYAIETHYGSRFDEYLHTVTVAIDATILSIREKE